MRILFIPSGYQRIYDYFDQCIFNGLKKFPGIDVDFFSPLHDFPALQWKCNQFKPDMVITLLGDHLAKETLKWIKHQSFRSVLWLTEDPYYTDRSIAKIPFFHTVYSIDRGAVDYYKSLDYKHVHQLSLGTDPEIFAPARRREHETDVCLVGYPYPDRIRLIMLLLKETPFRIQVIGNKWQRNLLHKVRNTDFALLNRWVPPRQAAYFYSRAKIVLNTHRPFDESTNENSAGIKNNSLNNRSFDIAACGSFQLTGYIKDLPDHFEEQEEIVSFRTDEELMDQLHYYLSNHQERQQIADNARKKVLDRHTFHHRLEKILFGNTDD
ncbi:glycosyltransferase [Bacillus sp. V59.32b]|uniref:CgeB family protein n=1 Tax=Bacillus sp. V59.32b TaxID=1758642 RepID=UPI000E3D8FD8|nr:glycosyltransferase [Bacillus sp. V59.32b]RFU64574.1 protein CgeB [Bacillus sp. V59.32b]